MVNFLQQLTTMRVRAVMLGAINLKVLVIDSDFYALQTINSILAWDRRTRVVALAQDMEQALSYLRSVGEAEWPDVVLLEAEAFGDAHGLQAAVAQLRSKIKNLTVIGLAHKPDPQLIAAAVHAGVRGYLLRNEVKLQLAWAVCYAVDRDLVMTPTIHDAGRALDERVARADILPRERSYPEMTDRIRQALWLYVVEGMSAQLAADEMGISTHTLRSYIKEGYRILEAHDDTAYPDDMGPQERAFMRFTALDKNNEPHSDDKP
ncbi:MAG: response regulator transcription factor [Anaerolineae bacterium]|nr:response regulator transcription factor [Anaerolineae bacterium]